jgi:hypothetical protein
LSAVEKARRDELKQQENEARKRTQQEAKKVNRAAKRSKK